MYTAGLPVGALVRRRRRRGPYVLLKTYFYLFILFFFFDYFDLLFDFFFSLFPTGNLDACVGTRETGAARVLDEMINDARVCIQLIMIKR